MKIIIITQHACDHACKHITTASLSKTGISSWVDVHITIRKGNHCILTLKYKNDIVFLGIFPCNSYSIGLYLFHRQTRSEEHTSELQSRFDLVCRLLLEKKKKAQH